MPVNKLKGFQKKYLRGLAHNLKPIVYLGQSGLTEAVIRSMEQALERHELVKVKFNGFKEKEQKTKITLSLEEETGSYLAGTIGHTAIFYRQQRDPEKRQIFLPQR